MLATGMMVCLGTLPVWSDDEVLLTLFPNASKAFGSTTGVQYDFGVGAKLTYRMGNNLDFFVEGDYKNLTLPNVSSATLLNGGVGAGYHLPINDRWRLNMSAQVGGYRASKSGGVLTGLSGGINISLTYRINPTVSVEAGAAANHYVAKPDPLMTDAGVSTGLTINLTQAFTNTTNIKMETKEVLPVFPVLYSWYKDNSFASVGITNEEDSAIDNVKVSFYQPQYMSQPNLCATREKLGKGESFDAELTAFFNERMLDLTEKTNTEASVIIEYTYLGQKKKKTIAMVVPVYGRNSMSWDDDRRASVFVSSKDPAALWFSKYITSIVRDNVRMGISPNIQYAMGIFETLDQFGINYVIDPSSAYSDNVGSTSIDFLQFPYQTLTYRGGDCDDLSILTCSLFEAVGIKTAFITIPGHIFIAFDSGMTMKEAAQSLMNSNNLINHDGEAWVPLEITLTDEGFSRAWRVGAREWNQAYKDGTAAFYAMEDSWKIYEPVSVPGASANFTMPEKEIVSRLFQHSMDQWIAREISPVVAQYNARLAAHDTVELRNELGILYGQYGLFVEADDQFKRARRKGYLPSLLNTANVYFARQQYTIALEWYRKVLEQDPNNELAVLGISRCYYELENYDECDAAYDIVRQSNPALAAEYTYLGAFEQTKGRSFSLADRIAMTKWDTGNISSGITNDGDDSDFDDNDDGFDSSDSSGFSIADLNTSVPGSSLGENADSLLEQLADMNDPTVMLRPDAVIREEDKTAVLPPNPYAAMDDYENLVEELPGLIAQLRLPEMSFDSTEPVIASDYDLIARSSTTKDTPTLEERRYVPTKKSDPSKDLSSLVTKSKPTSTGSKSSSTPAASTQPTVAETPAVSTPTVNTPTVAVAQPTSVETPVVSTPTVAISQPTVAEMPVVSAPTVEIAQSPTVTEMPAVSTPTVAVTQPSVETHEVSAPRIEIAQLPTDTTVAGTPRIEEAQPRQETAPVSTPAVNTPTVEIAQPTVETPVVSAPKIEIAQLPTDTNVTAAPKIVEAQPKEESSEDSAPEEQVTQPSEETHEPAAPTIEVSQPTDETQPVSSSPVSVAQPIVETPDSSTPRIAQTGTEIRDASTPIIAPATTPTYTQPTQTVATTTQQPAPVTTTTYTQPTQTVATTQQPTTVAAPTYTQPTQTVATTQQPETVATPTYTQPAPTVATTQQPATATTTTYTQPTQTVATTQQPATVATPTYTQPTQTVATTTQQPATVTTTTYTQPTQTVATTTQQPTPVATPTYTQPTQTVATTQQPATVATPTYTQPAPTVATTQQPATATTPTYTQPTQTVATTQQPTTVATPTYTQPASTVATTQQPAPTYTQPTQTVATTTLRPDPVNAYTQQPVPSATTTYAQPTQTAATTTLRPDPVSTYTQPTVAPATQQPAPAATTTYTQPTQPVATTTLRPDPVSTYTQPTQTVATTTQPATVATPTYTQPTPTVATTTQRPTSVATPTYTQPTQTVATTQQPATVTTTTYTQPTQTVATTTQQPTTTRPVVSSTWDDEEEDDIFSDLIDEVVADTSKKTEKPVDSKTRAVPKFDTPEVVIESTDDFLAELGLDEEEVFAALLDDDTDDFADTPIGSLLTEDKGKKDIASFGPALGPALNAGEENDEVDVYGEELAYLNALPTVERDVPRFTDSPSSEWVPEEVYTAKIIPGMKTYEEEMKSYGKDKSYLYEDNLGLLSDDTEESIAMEIEMEKKAEQDRIDAQYALENWNKMEYNDDDPTSPLFSYLSADTLEEIQHVSIVDKIREQGKRSIEERAAEKAKKKSLLAKGEDKRQKLAASSVKKAEPEVIEEPQIEEAVEPIAQVQESVRNDNIIEEKTPVSDVDTAEEKKGRGMWPYVAGGTGLFGLFIFFLIVFWKRDDDDDEDENKDSLDKKGVTV